jgi:lambda family phage portal protein
MRRQRRRVSPTFLDRAIAAVSPGWGLKRIQAKSALSDILSPGISRTGGGLSGTLKNWLPKRIYSSAKALERERLVDRSLDLAANDANIAGLVKAMGDNVVGTGYVPQSRVRADRLGLTDAQADEFQRSAEWAWTKWVCEADCERRWHFEDLVAVLFRSAFVTGDGLAAPVWLSDQVMRQEGRQFSFSLQMLSSLRLKTPYDLGSNGQVVDGVELGDRRQPVGYWIQRYDSGYARWSRNASDFTRYPARRGIWPGFFHFYAPGDPEEVRGRPTLEPVIKFARDLGDFLDAELVSNIVTAAFAVWVETNDPYGAATGFETTTSQDDTSDTQRYQEIIPGQIMYGRPGEKVSPINPDRPGQTFAVFVERILRAIGASVGLPYEVVAKDFSKTNYSSARAALLEAHRVFRRWQEWQIRYFCRPVWQTVLFEAVERGMIILPAGAPDFLSCLPEYTDAFWIRPARGHVDPVKERQAEQIGLQNGTQTYAATIAEQGGDWEMVFEQRARERKKAAELGIPDALDAKRTDAGRPKTEAAEPAEEGEE